MALLNFRSVSVKGAINRARARVLFGNALLKVFDADGNAKTFMAEQPKRRKGHIRVWDVETSRGTITLRGKCITCGGRKWNRVTYMPANDLWNLSR